MTDDPSMSCAYLTSVPPGPSRSVYSVRKTLSRKRSTPPAGRLAAYFFECCPSFSWAAGTEQGPFSGAVSVFAELLRYGADEKTCRAMVDLYFDRLGNQSPPVPYIWHFKSKRYRLLAELNAEGADMTENPRPPRLNPGSGIAPIDTRYAGCRFRSRLEARWAVFFDSLGVRWEYEPQGFVIPRSEGGTTAYLPDFYLPDSGTWVEVKGSEEALDRGLMEDAACALPRDSAGPDPALLLLGPIPDPPSADRDLGWLGLSAGPRHPEGPECCDNYWGFGGYLHQHALSRLDISSATAYQAGGPWLEPCISYQSMNTYPGVPHAYEAARGARFEHGERGLPREE